MKIGVIAAVSETGLVARADGSLPWTMPSDLAHFKRTTTGCGLVVGRRTFDLLPRKMLEQGDRQFFVLSRSVAVGPTDMHGDDQDEHKRAQWHLGQSDDRYLLPNVHVVRNVDQAIYRSADMRRNIVWSIGGPQTWNQSLTYASRLLISRIHVQGDDGVFWQCALEARGFHLATKLAMPKGDKDQHDWTVEYWRRGS